ncbi:ubiquinone biosynthesis O-methyltransferase, mitochondrial-like [Toxorhynchites rutilus septentrionalis]|uniref:ubiquinone biosynthesis O-methyltransferase, mitochondrial-like n=1 Tax=Toxorhynchites rutilus septentrionalis TaxID=329112 RepID=UPI0024791C16|nr:ubiquinone biosynthesis O-methyltransferase, mitochondrial-like [Toxorhynchites rutilus septentrionalis]
MSPYYGMYVVIGLIFRVLEIITSFLKLNVVLETLEARFGNIIIGRNDDRPKEESPKDSVSKTEIDHMASLVKIWWNREGSAKMLHSFHQVRVPLVVDGLAEVGRIPKSDTSKQDCLRGVKILEAGCGGGILAEDLAKRGAHVVGIDPCKEMIELAKTHLDTESADLKDRIEYHLITVEEHAKEFAERYDAIVCSEVMEHVDQKESILEACVKCLKPGGSLFITTENQTMLAWFIFIIIPEYILKFIPKGTHYYEKFIAPVQISKIIEKYGCKTLRVRGFFYDRMSNRWSFIGNDDCNYGLHAVKN